MTRIGSLSCGNVSGNAVISVSTVGQGSASANTTRNALELSRDLDRWRRALGEGSMAMSAARRIPIRARLAHQRVLDEFAVIAKKCRKRRRLSIEAVARQSGIPAKLIQQFERRAVAAAEPEIVRLSAVYGVGAAVITRRLKRVFDQFARSDVCAIDNLLHLKWSKTRKAAVSRSSAQGAGVASRCRGARDGADHDLTMSDWPALLPPTLGESILAECIQLLTLTTCVQAVVANDGAPVPIQRDGNLPPPASAGAEAKAIRMMKGDELIALVHANLKGMVDRLDLLTRRHPAHSGAGAEFTHPQGIGDVVPIPHQEIHAERARIADAMQLIARFKTRPALPAHEVHWGTHVPIDTAEAPCQRQESPAQYSVSTLNCAIDQLSEAADNLFQLSGYCA